MPHRATIIYIVTFCAFGASCNSAKEPGIRRDALNVSVMPREFYLDFFPIMPWELPPRSNEFADPKHGLQSVVDCGFTLIGFARPKDLPACEKLGIKAIVATEDRLRNWREISDQQIDSTIARWV